MLQNKSFMHFLVLSLCLFYAGSVHAYSCKATAWPYARNQSEASLIKQFKELPRNFLIDYFFSEVTNPKQPSVAVPLSLYLTQTEANTDLRQFYLLVTEGAAIDTNHREPKKLDLQEICSVYKKVINPSLKNSKK